MRALLLCAAAAVLAPAIAFGQKVYLNPSNQTNNAVAGGGNEAQYALIDANKTKTKLDACGFTTRVDQDFNNAPANANSWGANVFVSIHTNAGGGHGTESLYKTTGGKTLAGAIQNGLLSKLPYSDRGLKLRTDLHVLNATNMYATLTECVFHDCARTSGYTGHPPSESAFMKSADGQEKIASGLAAGVVSYFKKTCGTPPPATGTVTGVVYKNPDLNSRIADATVKVNTGASKVFDGNAPWAFDLPAGTYTLTATAAGFKPGTKTATVVAGQTTWASIGLDPVAQPGPDAGAAPGPDAAEPPGEDAAASAGPDAAAPQPGADAGAIAADAASGKPGPVEAGCGCSAAGGVGTLAAALPLLWIARRRRT